MTICTRCEIDQEDFEFSPDAKKLNGLASWCHSCKKEKWHLDRANGPTAADLVRNAKVRVWDRTTTIEQRKRQNLIAKLGIDLVETMEGEK